MSTWKFGVTDLDGLPIGEVLNAQGRTVTRQLNGLDTASFTLRAENPMVDKIVTARLATGVLLKVYQGSTLKFIGDLVSIEETGPGYKHIISCEELMNQAYVLPPTFPDATDVKVSTDTISIAARGLFQGVVPSDVSDGQLRQALADAHVEVRKDPKEQITFEPISDTAITVAFNFAGPLWRLQHRLLGTPYTVGQTAWVDTALQTIISDMLVQANTVTETGIRLGTTDSLYSTTVGVESSWQFKPISECITEVQAAKLPYPVQSPTVYFLRDLFSGSPGVVNGRTPDSVGASTWTTSGSGVDWDTTAFADMRRAGAETGQGRLAIYPRTHGAVVAGMEYGSDVRSDGTFGGPTFYLYVRFSGFTLGSSVVNTGNWVRFTIGYGDDIADGGRFGLDKSIGGTITNLGFVNFSSVGGYIQANTNYGVRLLIDDAGNYTAWHFERDAGTGIGTPWFYGQDDDLASGGVLGTGTHVAAGESGRFSVSVTRVIDNVFASDYTGPQSFDFNMRPVEPVAETTYFPDGVKIAELDVPLQLGSLKPNVILERGDNTKPQKYQYGTDYEVGDTITGRGKFNGASRFNALFRIYGMTVSIDNEGKVTESPTLIP